MVTDSQLLDPTANLRSLVAATENELAATKQNLAEEIKKKIDREAERSDIPNCSLIFLLSFQLKRWFLKFMMLYASSLSPNLN